MSITLWQSLINRAEEMAGSAFEDIHTLEGWKQIRPKRHQEFMRSLGLDPLPARCDLGVADYGEFGGDGFRARRIAFQILPDCWSSACVYYPEPLPAGPAPGVLYVCGHAAIGTHHCQSHPIMWARRGYVCLIVDTIEQNDNPGEHHGFEMGTHNAWLSMGYSAAGGEMWNAVRALDVLAADAHVDPERLAVTGVSGGGACSFHLAAADERVKAVSTLCGISTPYDAIANRHLISHCNCMYFHNVYRRDTSEFAALIAPRAALFCFADDDRIFNPAETRKLVERTKRIYRLHDKEDRCELVTCPGPHGDHPEFDEATSRWFDRHVAGEERPLVARGKEELPETATSVFNGRPPSPNRTGLLPQLMSVRGTVPLPQTPEDWPRIRGEAMDTFPAFPDISNNTSIEQFCAWKSADGTLTAHRGRIEGVDVWLHTSGPTDRRNTALVMGIAGPGEGSMDLMGCVIGCVDRATTVAAGFEPRLSGLTVQVPQASRADSDVRKWSITKLLPFALPLTGQTPVMMTASDIRVAVDYLLGLEGIRESAVYLYGKGDAGVAALYAALADERVSGVIVEDAPSSHLDGAPILGILRALDMPQAVGLMAPRKAVLIAPGHNYWTWPSRAYERLGCSENFVTTGDLRKAIHAMIVR